MKYVFTSPPSQTSAVFCCALFPLLGATGAAKAASADDLAKATANPVAAMISVPLQSNWDKGYGPGNDVQYSLNVQPVIPVSLSSEWNLITRTILPLVHQPALSLGQGDAWGLGDTVASFFLSPNASSGLIWGAGPVFLLPTASRDRLGTEKWAAGPTGVVLIQQGAWTYGVLANHLWSFAGDDARSSVNLSYANPFLSHGLGGGWTVTVQGEVTQNWDAPSGQKTTLPLSAVVSKVMTLSGQPLSIGLGYKYFVEAPNGQPDWGIRMTINFLFPK